MKNSFWIASTLGTLALATMTVVVSSPRMGHADAPPVKPSVTSSALAAGASASASSAAQAKKPLPEILDLPALSTFTIPTEKTEMPPVDGWSEATRIKPTRSRAPSCEVHLLREYVKVTCPMNMAGIRQFAGNAKDVRLRVPQKPVEGNGVNLWAAPFGADITFPLRRGEGYVFQFFTIESGYDSVDAAPSTLVDVHWPVSEERPTLVLQ